MNQAFQESLVFCALLLRRIYRDVEKIATEETRIRGGVQRQLPRPERTLAFEDQLAKAPAGRALLLQRQNDGVGQPVFLPDVLAERLFLVFGERLVASRSLTEQRQARANKKSAQSEQVAKRRGRGHWSCALIRLDYQKHVVAGVMFRAGLVPKRTLVAKPIAVLINEGRIPAGKADLENAKLLKRVQFVGLAEAVVVRIDPHPEV